MQPIYIDLHIHTSENANNLNTNYDIAELVGQIKKQNGDSPFMISLTDHNTINKSAYLKAQNLGLNLIIGVELHIQNRAEAKSYHCHIYFNAPCFCEPCGSKMKSNVSKLLMIFWISGVLGSFRSGNLL